MKTTKVLTKSIKNVKDGYHLNSTYWQNWKKSLPPVPTPLMEISIGMCLGDSTIAKVSKEAYIKFEQGWKQKEFLYHLFSKMKLYCFIEEPGIRYQLDENRKKTDIIKSYWFKTFSLSDWTSIYDLFYQPLQDPSGTIKYRKTISPNLVRNHVTEISLAYWVISDGSYSYNPIRKIQTFILHTQGFTKQENQILASELNTKFNLHTTVESHKKKYWVINIPEQDFLTMRALISPYMIPSIMYKVP